jgi:hypothetical protein
VLVQIGTDNCPVFRSPLGRGQVGNAKWDYIDQTAKGVIRVPSERVDASCFQQRAKPEVSLSFAGADEEVAAGEQIT